MSAIALPHGFTVHFDISDRTLIHVVEDLPFATPATDETQVNWLIADRREKFYECDYQGGILLDSSFAPVDLPRNVVCLAVESGAAFANQLMSIIGAMCDGNFQALLNLQQGYTRKLDLLASGLEEIVLWTDEHFRILNCTDAAPEAFEERRGLVIGAEFRNVLRTTEDDLHTMLAKRAAVGASEKIEIEGVRRGGKKCWFRVGVRETGDKRYLLNLIDVTSQKEADKRFIQLSNYDPMTGLANRGLLFEFLQHAMSRAKRSGRSVALLLVDLDHFSRVSTQTGAQLGDDLITAASDRIKHLLNDQAMLARWGGDELAIVMEDVTQLEGASRLAQRIISLMSNPFIIDNEDHYVSPSIGIAVYPEADETLNGLIQAADTAMFEAKKEQGRNTYRFYLTTLQEAAEQRARVEQNLRRALDNGEFRLAYQPKVSIRQEAIIGFEALLRWHHPEWNMVSPEIYIPVAEECGLISQIGDWVLREACTQLASWREMFPRMAECSMAINVSAKQLSDPYFAQKVASCLADAGLSSEKLELELTESAIMDNPEEGIRVLEQLHSLGIKISIDDFGTGYSSLSYLRKLPIDCIKIDRSFVTEIGVDESAESIIQAILVMSSKLGLTNVAEGIETSKQMNFFEGSQCDVIQGYIFSKPLNVSEVEALFADSVPPMRDRFQSIAAGEL
ncbi:MAG: EAL domain-containing protein [Pseudomonadales bacterium]|nr:EAL domain-containing protein [Pseudomonadales bacterium]